MWYDGTNDDTPIDHLAQRRKVIDLCLFRKVAPIIMSLKDRVSYPLKFHPIAKERLWGGKRLAPFFSLHSDETIGEVWTLSGHKNGTSICKNGPLAGQSLTHIVSQYPELYLGKTDRSEFPLLIKFIHAEQDLSVQIHPDDQYAQKYEGDFGKTESWYILEAKPGAKVNYGHTFPTRETYEQAVKEGRVEKYLQYKSVSKDDFVHVPSRTLHAIMNGVMLIEIQQTSDVTYRVHDWNRVDKHGNPRQLHTRQAADVLEFNESVVADERTIVFQSDSVKHEHLVSCHYFTIDKWDLSEGHSIPLGKKGQPDILICARGSGVLSYRGSSIPITRGDTLLVPADLNNYEISPTDQMTVLRTYY